MGTRRFRAPVIPREGGVSSTPRRFDSITSASEYWIVRLRGRCRQTHFRILAARCARSFADRFALENKRAQGKPGARCTRGLMCKWGSKGAHEHTGSAESIRLSLRSGFTAYFVISPVSRALLPPSPTRNLFLKNLAPASGARTTRLRRPLEPRSSVAAFASTASHRAFMTTRDPPLSSGETNGNMD